MNARHLRAALSALALLALAPFGAGAAERAGEVLKAQPDAFQKAGFAGVALGRGSTIFRDATVYTKRYGTAEIRLDDDTQLMIGPDASIVIDQYVYGGGGATLAMRLGKGALRVISGDLRKEETSFRTEVATIGVRGTQFWLDVDTPGITRLWVDEGTVIARPVDADRDFIFHEPVYAECNRVTCRETWPPPRPIVYPHDPRPRK